jgi:hypothetical protein
MDCIGIRHSCSRDDRAFAGKDVKIHLKSCFASDERRWNDIVIGCLETESGSMLHHICESCYQHLVDINLHSFISFGQWQKIKGER